MKIEIIEDNGMDMDIDINNNYNKEKKNTFTYRDKIGNNLGRKKEKMIIGEKKVIKIFI